MHWPPTPLVANFAAKSLNQIPCAVSLARLRLLMVPDFTFLNHWDRRDRKRYFQSVFPLQLGYSSYRDCQSEPSRKAWMIEHWRYSCFHSSFLSLPQHKHRPRTTTTKSKLNLKQKISVQAILSSEECSINTGILKVACAHEHENML